MPNTIYQCVGTNQTQGSYYKRMHDYYNAHKPEGCHCSHLAIQGQWGKIQRSVNKFCGFKTTVDHRNESDKNEQDRVNIYSPFVDSVCCCGKYLLWIVTYFLSDR
jgi:hypothetical protein